MPERTEFNILSEPLIRVAELNGKTRELSLASVLAALQADETIEFCGLRAHQSHAWHAFLCQVAAAALHRAAADPKQESSPERWREMLLDLTEGEAEPWCLIVDDLSRPAFFQPPVPEGSLAEFKNSSEQPDLIDLLVTSKNHDIKRRRAVSAAPEHWAFALVSLQTSDGFGGRSNYGVVRMNGGYGSRSCITVARSDGWATRFQRDVAVLLESRSSLVEDGRYRDLNGHLLLWTLPWDGKASLALDECDPHFVEICRRVRLIERKECIVARYTGTQSARIAPGETKGNVGDPWVPIRREDGAALTPKNLSYNTVQNVMFGSDFQPSIASGIRPEDGDAPLLIAKTLVRGQGGTEGYHERAIPCSPRIRRMLADPDGRGALGTLARQRVEMVGIARRKILKPALAALLQGGPDRLNFDDERADRLAQDLDPLVDEVFFSSLFDDVGRDPGDAKRAWGERLLTFGRQILDEAIRGTPIPEMRRLRAISAAEAIFYGSARKNFADNFPTATGETNGLRTDPA